MKNQFKTIDEVWTAIDNGETVYWRNESYQLTIENARPNFKAFTIRNDKCLRVTCMSNWFGSLLEEKEITNLFTSKGGAR